MKIYKKRFITLIEIMIVMFLIALITGAIAYNFRGTMDEGKAFKTKVAMERVETILNLKVSENPESLNSITADWQKVIIESPMVSNPDALIRDGWGVPFEVAVDDNGAVKVRSRQYETYRGSGKSMF
jgi:type II secretory pathway pseudopilin PulG